MWYHPRPGMAAHGAALIGMYLALIGFGMLALDAAIGILLIPAGLLLAIFGHEHHRRPRQGADPRVVAMGVESESRSAAGAEDA